MRFGTGPVFAYERIVAARRWILYAGRSFLVAALLVAIMFVASKHGVSSPGISSAQYAQLGQYYFYALIGVELTIVMLAAPAATAGAICLDRARGNLAHMLVTDLSDAEIVLGKLAARLLPVLGLVACSWPVMALCSLLGGIDPKALSLAFAVIVATALFGCALAIALSVWARKTHEVVLATYTVLGCILLAYAVWDGFARSSAISRPPEFLLWINPVYMAYVPYWYPGTASWFEYGCFFVGSLGLSVVLALLAVWRMRPRTLREMGRPGVEPRMGRLGWLVRRFPSPSLDANPVLWREWHRSRPTPWMLVLVFLVFGSTTCCCVFGAASMLINGVHAGPPNLAAGAGIYGYILQVVFGLLMFAAVAPTALAEERQRGSLDVLMTTPLSTRTIVLGKWWGTYRFIPMLTFGPAIVAFAMAFGPWDPGSPPFRRENHSLAALAYAFVLMVLTLLIHGAFLTSLGLALATWMRRMSRAMAISVSAYVLIAIGWPILVVSSGPIAHDNPLPLISPIFVAGGLADFLGMRLRMENFLVNATICDAIVLFAAAALLAATVRTFDRCLDRMPESALRRRGRAVRKSRVYDAELIGEWEAG